MNGVVMLRNLKSLFIIEEESSEKKSPSSPLATSKPSAAAISESREGRPGKVNDQFTEVLFRAMEAQNLEGFDYLEYKQSLRSLRDMPMDEPTRYQSAMAMARTMGASGQSLMDSAQYYINVLREEERKFEAAAAKQKSQQVGAKEEQFQQLEEAVKTKEAEIQRLQNEITAHREEMKSLRQEIKEASEKVESTQNDFIASYNNLVNQIHADIEKMKQYLQ
jgi:chromosome segregation ATPase